MLRRLLLALGAVVGLLGACAAPALAAPELAVEMSHANAYGLQATECPTHKEEYFPGEPEKDCGVDPFTGSGTTFARESGYNTYELTIRNIGSASTTEPVNIEDNLPDGLLLDGTSNVPSISGTGWHGRKGEGSCTAVRSGTAVECINSVALAPSEAYQPLVLHIYVEGQAPVGQAFNVAAASSSGASAATISSPTQIAPAVPFGIESFSTSVQGPLGTPFTQAAGHPYAATGTFVFDGTPDTEGEVWTAGGSPKSVETDLPAGFLGNPQNVPKCTTKQLISGREAGELCPAGSAIGLIAVVLGSNRIEDGKSTPFANINKETQLVYNLVPQAGVAADFGFLVDGAYFGLEARVRSDGDYGVRIGDEYSGRGPNGLHGIRAVTLTICGYGVTGQAAIAGQSSTAACADTPRITPLLTTPARCTGAAPITTLATDTYTEPADYVSKTVYNGAALIKGEPSATESFVTGCNALQFTPEIDSKPTAGTEGGTTELDQPTGAQFDLKIPQSKEEAGTNSTPALKTATVTLPAGMTANPAAAGGLEVCSDADFGLGSTIEPAEPAHCPLASQVGTVEVCTPLLENQTGEAHSGEEVDVQCEEGKAVSQLQGQVFIGQPQCSLCSATNAEEGKLFRLFLQIRAPERGIVVKLAGKVSANPLTGRLQATFTEQPQLPFGELRLKLRGGPRAPLAAPQTCGAATTTAILTPWSAPGLGGLTGTEPIVGTPSAEPASTFDVDWNGAGGACPSTLPFSPTFSAGTETSAADASSPLSVTIGRQDREQDLADVTVSTPPGLFGKVSEISQCGEAEANAGTCPASSQIGTAAVAAGAGTDPYWLSGAVYLTGPYAGDPYGLSVAVPTEAGPFKLAGNAGNGMEVVRAGIAINPTTAALTVKSDPLPQVVDGVQLRLRTVHIEVNRPGFIVNPTSCTQLSIGATITGSGGTIANTSSPFGPTGCSSLPFHPVFSASASPQTSLKDGASLDVTVTAANSEANIGRVDLTLPKALPSRLSTLHQACTESQFAANPAGCPEGSDIGTATARTPLLSNPLVGPIYVVSHGGAAFPDIEFVLQGENSLTIVLDGKTQITDGITYSRLELLPDAPILSFVADLPEGPHSILGATENLCATKRLSLGVAAIGQNGRQETESVPIAVNGCKPSTAKTTLTRAQKLKRALAACGRHYKHAKAKRVACERVARKRYSPKPRASKAAKSRRPR